MQEPIVEFPHQLKSDYYLTMQDLSDARKGSETLDTTTALFPV